MEYRTELWTESIVTEHMILTMTMEEYRALSNVLNKRNSLQCSEAENMIAYKVATLDTEV